jgi:hypothetical protein
MRRMVGPGARLLFALRLRFSRRFGRHVISRLLLNDAEDVLGIRVGFVGRKCADPADAISKIRRAMRLLRQWDPARFRRLTQHIDRIVLSAHSKRRGLFLYGTKTCVLRTGFVLDFPPSYVAFVLVHESTHARIDMTGLRIRPDLFHRIEMRCIAEELRFAKCLPHERFPEAETWSSWRAGEFPDCLEVLAPSERRLNAQSVI